RLTPPGATLELHREMLGCHVRLPWMLEAARGHQPPAYPATSVLTLEALRRHTPSLGGFVQRSELLQGVDGGLHYVVGIGAAEALAEDAVEPRRLEHRACGTASDNARTFRSRHKQYPPCAVVAHHLVGDRPVDDG